MGDHKELNLGIFSRKLNERIGEVSDQKGYSLRALAEKVHINRETIRKIIVGEREILPSEIELFANAFKLTVERLTQQDIHHAVEELEYLLKNLGDKNRALELAQFIREVSVGTTENYYSYYYLGRAYFDLEEYADAENAWEQANFHAQVLKQKYKSSFESNEIIKRLSILYSITKENRYRMETILEEAKEGLNTLEQYSVFYYAKAMIQKWHGNLVKAKELMNKSLDYAVQTGNPLECAIAEHNVAELEFWAGNYEVSKAFHIQSIKKFEQHSLDSDYTLISYKDYAKTLAALKEHDEAIAIINRTLALPGLKADLRAKLTLILSSVTGDPTYAKSIFVMDDVSNRVQQFSCRFLMDFYEKQNDAVQFLVYYKKSVQLSNTYTNVFQEEEF